jgi:hypothetical protein
MSTPPATLPSSEAGSPLKLLCDWHRLGELQFETLESLLAGVVSWLILPNPQKNKISQTLALGRGLRSIEDFFDASNAMTYSR